MSNEVFACCEALCPCAVLCLHCAATADGDDGDHNKHFRKIDFCTNQCGNIYIHDLKCTKQADGEGL